VNGYDDRIILELGEFIRPELFKMLTGKLKPGRERIASNDSCTQRLLFHEISS
jgi:hypothetical protein